jgi:hypothetical protein
MTTGTGAAGSCWSGRNDGATATGALAVSAGGGSALWVNKA